MINETESRLSIVIDAETRDLLQTARDQLSHSVPDGSLGEILKRALKEFVKQGDTARQRILTRAGHRCEWLDPRTKRRCSSTFQIQIDHIHPRALGGSDLPSNLRCLCRQHNLFAAEQAFGREKMARFRAHR
jgi:5-methylcytosine-specific restriction endonuclease McrA